MHAIEIGNGKIITPDSVLPESSVTIRGSRIYFIGTRKIKGALFIDAKGCFVSPGFIDTHIHGDPGRIIAGEIPRGTTSFVIAISCAMPKTIYRKIELIKGFCSGSSIGKAILGARLEGPYISKVKAGAQDMRHIKNPDIYGLKEIIKRSGAILKIMTVAPELPGAEVIIRELVKSGIMVSIGHSDASYKEAKGGIASGIRHATHLFNAMSGKEDCRSGVVGAVLADRRVWAEVIGDMAHVPIKIFNAIVKIKGPGKTVLITDSIKAETRKSLKPSGPVYRSQIGSILGSSISMIDAVRNTVGRCDFSLPEAVKMASLNPAKILGVECRKGSIEPGKDADIVIFDKSFNVKTVIVSGKIVYRT